MTLKQANYKIERLDNQIRLLMQEKEQLELSVGIKASSVDKIIVDGGLKGDKLLNYVYQKKLKRYDEKIKNKLKQKEILHEFIDNELKTLQKYNKIERLIVYYKEEDPRELSWQEIGTLINYSKSQASRIYKNYRQKTRK